MAGPFHNNADHPFGSARFAGPEEIARAGLFTHTPNSLLVGFFQGRALWYSGMGGAMCVAGPRSGKLRDLLAYNICHSIHTPSMIILDVKGELAAISQNQAPDKKFCLYWNARGLHGLPQHRINPLDFIYKDSRSLITDIKTVAENKLPDVPGSKDNYFPGRGREFIEAISITCTMRDGVLTYPALYRAINLMVIGGDAWLDFAFEMQETGIESVQRIGQEITNSHQDSSGGFRGIVGEVTKSFSSLSDPELMASVSPPYDASMADVFSSAQTYQLYLMPPAETVNVWGPVIKAFFVAARTYKARAPSAPRVTFVLDEIGNLGAFPLVQKLYTLDAGLGIRAWGFWQSTEQMKSLAPGADTIIPASAALTNWFGIRDDRTAQTMSQRLGTETLEHVDYERQMRAQHAKRQAALAAFSGQNPFTAAMEARHQASLAGLPTRSQRALMPPDEVLGMSPQKQMITADGLAHPILADRFPYYEMPFMAGRYHPNPYFPTGEYVQVATRRGPVWRRVRRERVPHGFSHFPQYQDGTWSRIT